MSRALLRSLILPALVCPLMLPVLPAAIAWSTALTLGRGGIRWRDTFHPLDELRRGRLRWGWRPKRARTPEA